MKSEVGVDWRTAEIQHYRTFRDLLGGTSFQRFDNDFWGTGGKALQPGDKFDYNNTNTVDWIGGFVQGEYTKDELTAYGMAGYSVVKYTLKDFFRNDGGSPFELESDNIGVYQIKVGASYATNDNMRFYANAGVVSKVRTFD